MKSWYENILNSIFCVRQTHTMLIVGLVKSLSRLPIVHRIKSKAHSLACEALWNLAPSSVFSSSDFSAPERCPSRCQVLGTKLGAGQAASILQWREHPNEEDGPADIQV